MLQKSPIRFGGVLCLAFSSALIAQASANTSNTTPWPPHDVEFGTGAYAVQDSVLATGTTNQLVSTGLSSPLTPPSLSGSLASSTLTNVTTGLISASTVISSHDSVSDSAAATIALTMGTTPNTDAILISAATSETRAHCHDVYPRLPMSTSVGTVSVNGNPVVVTGAPNQIVPLPNSAGQLILNQQIEDDFGEHQGRAVANAVNASAPGQDVIVAHTQGFADCWDQR